MKLRVSMAIAGARLRAEYKALAYACAAAAVAGFLQRNAQAGGVLVFCGLLGIAVALLQAPGRHRYLDVCEQSAPLFGRQLARGKALAACAGVILGGLAYCAGLLAGGGGLAPLPLACAFAGGVATTLVALSATIRSDAARALYVVLAAATTAVTLVLPSPAIALVLCAAVGFIALRQYGEALARWDPAAET